MLSTLFSIIPKTCEKHPSSFKILQYVIIIKCIDLWGEYGATSCEAVIRAGRAWDQEVTSALSVIAVCDQELGRHLELIRETEGVRGGKKGEGWVPTCRLWKIGKKNCPTLTSDSVASAASESVNWRRWWGEKTQVDKGLSVLWLINQQEVLNSNFQLIENVI